MTPLAMIREKLERAERLRMAQKQAAKASQASRFNPRRQGGKVLVYRGVEYISK